MANKRFIVRHGLDNSGDNSVVNTITNVAEPVNNSDAATKYYVDTHTSGGTVTSVTATSPVESTGGTAPVISLGTGANGQLVIGTGTGFTKSTLTAGTGVSIANASGGITISATGSGGDVVGPASSTDNAIVRFDSTTGKLIQNSTATLSDGGIMVVTELDTDSIKSATANSPIVIAPDGTGDVHLNADSVRIGDNNADATIATRGTGDLIITTNEGSGVEGIVRLYDGANGNITLTPNGTGQVQVGSDQVVTLIASQTLTNKSLSGSSNTFTNIPNSATTATSANTASAIVARDASGNFSAGTITATLSGNATNVTGTVAVNNGGTGLTSLTAGYIPYGNGTSAFGSSANLFWDSANSRLGVGTSSPAHKLDVSVDVNAIGGARITNTNTGSSSGASSFYSNGTHTHELGIVGTNYGGYGALTASNFYLYAGGNNSLSLLADGTGVIKFGTGSGVPERMRLDSSGNLGVGTSSPAFKLHTYIASGTSMFKFESGANAGIYGYWTRPNQSYIQALNLDNNGDKDFSLYDATNGQVADRYYPSSAGYRAFFTNGSERMRIDSSGRVGIAVTPSAWQTSSYKVLQISDGGAAFWGQADAVDADISTNAYIDSSYQFRYIKAGAATWYRALDGYFYWNTASSGSANGAISFSERMRLTIDGNLGIGTSSPSNKLHIAAAGLDISGGIAVDGSTMQGIRLQNTVNTNSSLGIWFGTNNVHWCGISGQRTNYASTWGTDLRFYTHEDATSNLTYSTERMRIDSSGNVGIGTSSPSTKLHVANGGSNAQATFVGTTGSPYITVVANSGTTILGNESNGGWVGTTGSQAFVFKTNDTERMRIDSSGNLGIGTSSPSQKLHIAGTTANLLLNGTSNTYVTINVNSSNIGYLGDANWMFGGSSSDFGVRATSNLVFGTSFYERMRVDSSGNLLIGNTNGTEKLTVTGKIKASDVLLGNNGTKGYGAITTTTTTSTPTGGSSGDHYYIY